MFIFIPRYKIPILISLATGLVYLALSSDSSPITAILGFVGALLAVLVLDAEYILTAYFIDPQHEKATYIKDMLRGKHFITLADYLTKNEYSFGELSIRSVLFQIVLAVFNLYLVVTNSFSLVTCLCLALMGNILYAQLIELQETGTLERWFWVYDGALTKRVYYTYLSVMALSLALAFYFL